MKPAHRKERYRRSQLHLPTRTNSSKSWCQQPSTTPRFLYLSRQQAKSELQCQWHRRCQRKRLLLILIKEMSTKFGNAHRGVGESRHHVLWWQYPPSLTEGMIKVLLRGEDTKALEPALLEIEIESEWKLEKNTMAIYQSAVDRESQRRRVNFTQIF